jgi:hypothetical protein
VSSFQISATIVTFLADQDQFTERRQNLLFTWDLSLLLTLATDYTTLLTLISQPVHVGLCPGSAGATPYVDIGNGVGPGTLTLDNVLGSPFNAALVAVERPSAYPSGSRKVRVTFQQCP